MGTTKTTDTHTILAVDLDQYKSLAFIGDGRRV